MSLLVAVVSDKVSNRDRRDQQARRLDNCRCCFSATSVSVWFIGLKRWKRTDTALAEPGGWMLRRVNRGELLKRLIARDGEH